MRKMYVFTVNHVFSSLWMVNKLIILSTLQSIISQQQLSAPLPHLGCTFRNSYRSVLVSISCSLSFSISAIYGAFRCSALFKWVILLTVSLHRVSGHSSWTDTSFLCWVYSTDSEIVPSWKKLSTCMRLGRRMRGIETWLWFSVLLRLIYLEELWLLTD